VGSPRKGGNTELMVKEALAAATEEGAETDIFLVAGKTISGCDGCQSCFKTGACKTKDDMQALYTKMEWADAIVFGTPVYFHDVAAQAKAVMDRCYCYLPSHKLRGKVVAPVLALGKIGASTARMHLFDWGLLLGMTPVEGAIGYGHAKGDVLTGEGAGPKRSAMEEARVTGKEVVEMVNKLGAGKLKIKTSKSKTQIKNKKLIPEKKGTRIKWK